MAQNKTEEMAAALVGMKTEIDRLSAQFDAAKIEYALAVGVPQDEPLYIAGGSVSVKNAMVAFTSAAAVAKLLDGAPAEVKQHFTVTKVAVNADKIEGLAKSGVEMLVAWHAEIVKRAGAYRANELAKKRKKADGSHLVVAVESAKS